MDAERFFEVNIWSEKYLVSFYGSFPIWATPKVVYFMQSLIDVLARPRSMSFQDIAQLGFYILIEKGLPWLNMRRK